MAALTAQALVPDDHPDALALLGKAQAAQNTLSALSVEKKDADQVRAAREAMLALKEEYKKLTGHYPKLEIVKKEKGAEAPEEEGGEAMSKRHEEQLEHI